MAAKDLGIETMSTCVIIDTGIHNLHLRKLGERQGEHTYNDPSASKPTSPSPEAATNAGATTRTSLTPAAPHVAEGSL